jgi:tetratricopeptide (TPR) repeat protein
MRNVSRCRWLTHWLGPHRIERSNRALQPRRTAVKCGIGIALTLACLVAAAPRLSAQAPDKSGTPGAGQGHPAAGSQSPAQQQPALTKPQTNANPFPEDTDSVPVMPSRTPSDLAPGAGDETGSGLIPMPPDDGDPVRSPEDAAASAGSSDGGSSSSMTGTGDLPTPDDDTTHPGKHKGKGEQVVPEHHETAAEDEDVGSYYLSNKDWKGALSRFQSALVLDPDNPDVYWGLAEAERHLGDFADARANYKKVMQYDPGSRHAKDAGKALQDPEIANAKPAPSGQPAQQPQP